MTDLVWWIWCGGFVDGARGSGGGFVSAGPLEFGVGVGELLWWIW
jgi:hypothetical protein